MSAIPLPHAPPPVTAERLIRLQAAVGDLDPAALYWASGYLAGLAADRSRGGAAAVAAPSVRATILYASQTGNGRRVAEKLGRSLAAAGLAASVTNVADYSARQLAQERLVYLITSTHGDGEPPDDARALVDLLSGRRAPRLASLAYAVLALGDSSYPQFCATGRQLDERLAELGARRLTERVECDVDYDSRATPWAEQAVALARQELGESAPQLASVTLLHTPAPLLASREAPLEVEVAANARITARDADRDVRHLELVLPDRHFEYEAGDAIGIVADNPMLIIDQVLSLTRLDATESVTLDDTTAPLGDWLRTRREVARIARPLLEALAARSGSAELADWLRPEQTAKLRATLKEQQVVDLLHRFPASWDAASLVRALHPLAPRLYSVASSRREVGDEAHLTVAVIDYTHGGEHRVGPTSWQLATSRAGSRVRAFVEPNQRFRVPTDGARDIVMIGPGTGVAPFRGFVQQRQADGARGRNWLIFGGRRRERDFLYQLEWQAALKKGALNRLDVAFSRDQAQKVYVQDRLREHGRALYEWLDGGAHLYVCGDAQHMAPDVHAALIEVIAEHGGRSREDATEYLNELAATRRYARDVY
ncbi:MAG: assimilatory sulfite reductase (NADPH) flavoprotein subunit [Pseudomonadota bacterium]